MSDRIILDAMVFALYGETSGGERRAVVVAEGQVRDQGAEQDQVDAEQA